MKKLDRCKIVLQEESTPGEERCTAMELYERMAHAIWQAASWDTPEGSAMVKPA